MMSTTAPKPATTPISVQLPALEFDEFIHINTFAKMR